MWQPQNKLKTKVITKNLDSIPFDEAARVWQEAANQAVERAVGDLTLAYDAEYKKRLARVEAALGSVEASFEGNAEIPYDPPTLAPEDLASIRLAAGNAALKEQFLKAYSIPAFGVSILDQLMVLLSKHKLNTLGSDGKISGLEYLNDNFDKKNMYHVGMYRFLMYDTRGDYLPKQTQEPSKKYCTLVPLIMYAHKLYNNVPYSSWDRDTLHYVVNKNLCQAMLSDPSAPLAAELAAELAAAAVEGDDRLAKLNKLATALGSDDFWGYGADKLLELRELGLRMGSSTTSEIKDRNPASTYSLYRLGDTVLRSFGALTRIMMLQTWCAHPSNRTKYMVLDPKAWDTVPPPLVAADVFVQTSRDAPAPLRIKKPTPIDNAPW